MKDAIAEIASLALVIVIAFLFAGLMAPVEKTIGTYHAERDACLKQATNGYEIERCR